MLPTKEICNQLRPGPEIGYIAERVKRVRTLTVGQEERARNMGIPIDALSLKWKFDVDYILNAIKAHLSKEDTELFPIYLSMMRTIPDVNVLRAITLLQEGLEKGSDRKEILARIRFISSTAEKSLYGPKRGVEYSASAIQEEIGSSADGIIPFLHISSDPKAPSIFRNDAKHLVGMSSAEGKITRLSAVLGIDITDTVIDILRSKSQEEGRFVFELFYSRQRDLADFLDALEIAAIPHAHKHVRLTFTPINDMAADVSVLYPWIRDTGIAAFTKDGKTVIVRPQLHNSYGSGANMLAWRFQTDVTSIPLFLSGGNVQQDTDTLFIGWSEILINIPRIGLSAIRPQAGQSVSHIAPPTPEEIEKVVSVLKEKFSKKVVIVGRDEEGEQSGDNPF